MDYQLLNLFDESNSLPNFNINCKFILVTDSDTLWLVFGQLSTYRYHAQLVQRFCVINDIGFSWVKKPDMVEVLDDGIEIKGGGVIAFERDKMLIRFSSHSTAYGKFDKVFLEKFFVNCTQIKGIEILFGK